VHFDVEDAVSLHVYTNYYLGFIEPFMLILLSDVINVALFCWFCRNKVNLAIFKLYQVWCFYIPFNWWIFVSLTQVWVSKGNQVFILFVCNGVICNDFHALDWSNYVDTNFGTFVNSCSYGMWPTLDLNLAMCFYV
jgi:hypothetical protein